MNKGRALLTYYTFNPEDNVVVAEYSIEQNNGQTSVEQKMTLEGQVGFISEQWTATIALDDFPPFKTPAGAAHKLADWLERLAAGIRAGEYELPSHSPVFKDLDDADSEPSTD